MKLPLNFYLNENVITVSKLLLGKLLVTNFNGNLTSGLIVETEAYQGATDRASHAYNNRRTKRTETMFAKGGVCYVYLCYGIHHLCNVVTAGIDIPHAVLIRAIQPMDGIEVMLKRRGLKKLVKNLTSGPGVLSQALGITTKLDGTSLLSDKIWIEDGENIKNNAIQTNPRIGVAYAKQDALLPYRFTIKNSAWLSKN